MYKYINFLVHKVSITFGEHRNNDIDKYVKFLWFKIDGEFTFKYHIKGIINNTAKGSYAHATL